MRVIVGAYAASPAHTTWDPLLEAEYYEQLAAVPGLRGLELPWLGGLHPHDDRWLLKSLPSAWDLVVTDVGGTVIRLSEDPRYGLGSRDAVGRRAAVDDVARLRDDVDRLNQAVGRRAVIAVELHSAPLASNGDSESLAQSLTEICGWDWGGARVLIEHCDTLVEGHIPEKGYLSLPDELSAIELSETPVGIALNWGRSAIELRDADRVLDHIALAANHLSALVFSGASSLSSAFGSAWTDAHLPFATEESTSLLNADRAAAALAAAGRLDWVGLKMGWRPVDAPIADRVRMIADGIRLIGEAAPALRTNPMLPSHR